MEAMLPSHPASLDSSHLLAVCDVRRTRRSGPGGQHRNKVETAIVLTHEPTGVQAEASERRSQAQNLSAAVFRLRVNLALAVRGPRDPAAGPQSRLATPLPGRPPGDQRRARRFPGPARGGVGRPGRLRRGRSGERPRPCAARRRS